MKLPFSQTFNEKPILFNTEMVKAVLEGRKTQTRRVVKLPSWSTGMWKDFETPDGHTAEVIATISGCFGTIPCPYGKPGDRLWVRETWHPASRIGTEYLVEYKTGEEVAHKTPFDFASPKMDEKIYKGWQPSIFMPRQFCRILLEITDIRVERVQEITESDAIAEGVELLDDSPFNQWKSYKEKGKFYLQAWQSFQSLWDSINEKRGFGWDVNPWVWVVEFKRIEMPLSEQQQLSQMQQDCYDNCEI